MSFIEKIKAMFGGKRSCGCTPEGEGKDSCCSTEESKESCGCEIKKEESPEEEVKAE